MKKEKKNKDTKEKNTAFSLRSFLNKKQMIHSFTALFLFDDYAYDLGSARTEISGPFNYIALILHRLC